jgi:hypothetical protein
VLVRSLPAIRLQVYEGLTFKDDTTSVQPRAYGDDGRVRHDDGRTAWAYGMGVRRRRAYGTAATAGVAKAKAAMRAGRQGRRHGWTLEAC